MPEPIHDPSPAAGASGHRSARLPERVLALGFLALLVGVPLVQGLVEYRRGDPLGALAILDTAPTAAGLRSYERGLEEANVFARLLRPGYQFVQFAWLHDGGDKALVGRDGWMFYKPGFDAAVARTPATATASTNDPVAAIVHFRDLLVARGVQLLVVPAPNKETIYPDQLTRRAPVGQVLVPPATRRFLHRLRDSGVECVDLFEVFGHARAAAPAGPSLYLAQDSHWSPAGVALAARAVAARLQALGWVRPGTQAFEAVPVPVTRHGDVLRLAQSPSIEQAFPPESVPCLQVRALDTGRPYADDPAAGVLVLGDSFLRIYQQDEPGAAGFIAHLARELQQPVTSLVSDGGASTLVRQELHRRPALLAHKRVVVWEFVERDLLTGAEGWQQVPLPPLPEGVDDAVPATAAASREPFRGVAPRNP